VISCAIDCQYGVSLSIATDYEYEYRQPSTIAEVAAPPKLNNYTYAPVEGLATQFAQTSIGSTASSQRHIRTRDPSRSEDPLNPSRSGDVDLPVDHAANTLQSTKSIGPRTSNSDV
jgi:hypothetical protein